MPQTSRFLDRREGANPRRILKQRAIDAVRPPPSWIEDEERRQLEVIEQHQCLLRHQRATEPVEGCTEIGKLL